ncbi:MAG: phosphotransferase [Candidatus Krumholzibacteriota bacterium]|nr:phosphotransferase [Candidatus Krumholzibacteriota bacterium]
MTGGGSPRSFFRLEYEKQSLVLLIDPGGGEEFEDYIALGNFLREHGIATPEFYRSDHKLGLLLMEDLGSLHLVEALNGLTSEEELSFYRSCLEILIRFRTTVSAVMLERGVLEDRIFDERKLLGETEYFRRYFIEEYCPVEVPPLWNEERKEMARRLTADPAVFMHRDFQSRNILVKNGELRIIDFQSAHRGPPLYDAASLLKDPYHPLLPGTRKTLFMEIFYRLNDLGHCRDKSFDEYYQTFILTGIQRNFQALGAYAFLGLVQGKTNFLDYIPAGLNLLEEGIDELNLFPAMRTLVTRIRERLRHGRP